MTLLVIVRRVIHGCFLIVRVAWLYPRSGLFLHTFHLSGHRTLTAVPEPRRIRSDLARYVYLRTGSRVGGGVWIECFKQPRVAGVSAHHALAAEGSGSKTAKLRSKDSFLVIRSLH